MWKWRSGIEMAVFIVVYKSNVAVERRKTDLCS